MEDSKSGAPPVELNANQETNFSNDWKAAITLSQPPSGTAYNPTYNLVPTNSTGYPLGQSWTASPFVFDNTGQMYPVTANPANPIITNAFTTIIGLRIGVPPGWTNFGSGLTIQIELQYSSTYPKSDAE